MTNTTVTKMTFDHGLLTSKALCIQFLREFGVQRDWARVNLPELRAMLRNYPDEKLFTAAKAIVERDGDTFDRSEFECPEDLDNPPGIEIVDDPDEADVVVATESETPPPPAPAPAPNLATKPAPIARPAASQAPAEPPAPSGKPPNVDEVAKALAQLMATNKGELDEDAVRRIAAEVAGEGDKALADAMTEAHRKTLDGVAKIVTDAIKNVEPREIVVRTERSEVRVEGLQHRDFETLLRMCSAVKPDGHRHNVWLYGPPGTGKTTAARNAAKALALPFYCTGALLTKYDITGFIDAGGNLVRTPFREAWENGGVYLFDEIDGSAPAAVVAFNAALANGVMAFPDKMVDRHPDCVVIAAANTTGLGATAEFTGRMKLDMATLDRFEMLEWPIDEKVEAALSSNKEWATIVQKVRSNVAAKGVKGVCITPRATIAGCSLLATGLPMDKVKQVVLRKAMSAEQWAMVAA